MVNGFGFSWPYPFRATNSKNKAVSDAVLSGESEAADGEQGAAAPSPASSTPGLPLVASVSSKAEPVSKNEEQLKTIET